MELKETQSKWGNLYKSYYFLDGKRISESYAKRILDKHCYEEMKSGKNKDGNWFTIWNIGPVWDTPSIYDSMDLI